VTRVLIVACLSVACRAELREGLYGCTIDADCPLGWVCDDYLCYDSPRGVRSGADPELAGADATVEPGGDSEAPGGDDNTIDRCAGVVCDPPAEACRELGVCDAATGLCRYDDAPDGAGCDDGDACTLVDRCAGGRCTGGSPMTCEPIPDPCFEAGVCEPSTGECTYAWVSTPVPCDDDDPCTESDVCGTGGLCRGTPIVCDQPPDVCHAAAGACLPNTGVCAYSATSTVCDPIVYWPLDDAGGTTLSDASGFRRDGALAGTAAWTAGRFGGGVSIATTYEGLTLANATAAVLDRRPLTFALWMQLGTVTDAIRRVLSTPLNFTNTLVVFRNYDPSPAGGYNAGAIDVYNGAV
jgi:hypothetical protein